jgi:hypothetical protein
MPFYRKKPVVIEAVQYTQESLMDLFDFMKEHLPLKINGVNYSITIPTLEGDMTASVNDFIIKGINGEFYPCKPDIFEKTYEPA